MIGKNRAFSKFPLSQFTAEANNADLNTLVKLIKDGKLRPHIEKTYPYWKIPEALGYLESMRTRGKVAMTRDQPFLQTESGCTHWAPSWYYRLDIFRNTIFNYTIRPLGPVQYREEILIDK